MDMGFTGTRHGMTIFQQEAFFRLCNYGIHTFRHGRCIGADEEGHRLIRKHSPRTWIVMHLPKDETHMSEVIGDEVWEPKTHFARNRDIVDNCEFLVATPFDNEEKEFGGTWYTYRYALKKRKPTMLIWPNGSLKMHP